MLGQQLVALDHEKYWGKPEKPCFARCAHVALLIGAPFTALDGSDPDAEALFVSQSKALALLRLCPRHVRRTARNDRAERSYRMADIGLTRKEALREAAKPFWRR